MISDHILINMIVGSLTEDQNLEKRVAYFTPDIVKKYKSLGRKHI